MSRARSPLLQFAEYMVGGFAYFWIGYTVFALCYGALHWNWLPAKILADIAGWTVNYLIQRYWAFASPRLKRREGQALGRYAAITVLNLGIDYLIIWALNSFGVTPYIGFFISAAFFTAWNYIWYRFWVFIGKESGNAKEVL